MFLVDYENQEVVTPKALEDQGLFFFERVVSI